MRLTSIFMLGFISSLALAVALAIYTPLEGWAALTPFVMFPALAMLIYHMWPLDVYTRLILDEIKMGKVNRDGTFKEGTLRLVCLDMGLDNSYSRVELRDGGVIVLWTTPTDVAAHRLDDALNSLEDTEEVLISKTKDVKLDLALISRIKGDDKCSPT